MLFKKLFEFTTYLGILMMYHEDGRIRCILGVSQPNRKTCQVCLYWSYPFFLHCFATWESLFWWSIFSESEILWTFFGFSWACNIVYDIGYESERNDIEIKLKFAPKGASNNYKSLHFVQWCILKAILWPPILICARYLLCNSAGGLGALWAPSGSRAELWWGPGALPLEALKT